MRLRRFLSLLMVCAGAAAARPARLIAQTDVIRGRITAPDSAPVANANITVTSVTTNVARATHTDKSGRFNVAFPGQDGDYFVTVAAIGFNVKKFEVKRNADEEILIADARLSRAAQEMDAVKVNAQRGKVSRNDDLRADLSGTERRGDLSNLAAGQMGDLASLAASLPGVQLIPNSDGTNGISVLGLTPDQSVTTLNGSNFNGSSLPPDAGISSSLVTSTYDVSRGGFSGGQFNITTLPGSNYIVRQSTAMLNAPQLQWDDPTARALGQQYTNVLLGGRVSGPLDYDKSFYNLSFSARRQQQDLQSLLNTSPLGLEAAGIAADSANRLLSLMSRYGVPATVGGVPSNRYNDNANFLASFDFNPPSSNSGQAFNVTVNGAVTRADPATSGVTELPAHSGDRTSWNGTIQGRNSGYYGIFLSQTTLSLSGSHSAGTPFVDLPSGNVLVNSAFPDGTTGVTNVAFGGSPSMSVGLSTVSEQLRNTLAWYSEDNKHTLKLTTELRRDDYTQNLTSNQLGTFTYNSLSDLAANAPAQFTRQLTPNDETEGEYVAGLALGDYFRPTSDLQLQYGVRLDGNQFTSHPAQNATVDQIFGVDNSNVPNQIYVSPRVGFSWTYGTGAQIAAFQGMARGPRAVVRGGIGMFQNTPSATTIASALANTGLPSAVQQLNCVGAAVPAPDWSDYLGDPSAIPSTCADGTTGTVFSNAAPNVSLFSPNYRAPRSLHSDLSWSGLTFDNRFRTTIGLTYALNLNQGQYGATDLNFTGAPRFLLADEDDRPVYALPSSIVPSTGFVAVGDDRVTPLFSHVSELESDLRSETRQVMVSLSPFLFNSAFSWNVSYVYMNAREQYRGFSSTTGDPLDVAWSRSGLDARHQITYALSYNAFNTVTFGWSGRFQSGSPYTPVVASDINGDGYANDRAFIFDPAHTADTSLAAGMQSLLASTSGSAHDCLLKQLGQLAGRNSCEGPWTESAVLNIAFNPIKVHMPQRASLSFQLANPLGAADLALHGENRLHGWGQTAFPQNQLLFVRGFNSTTQEYEYEVNQRFGSTALAQTALRTPVVLTALLRVDEGPTRERQVLTQTLDRGRIHGGQRAPEALIKAMFGTGGVINPMSVILSQADTLKLTTAQADSIAVLNRDYTNGLDAIWNPLAKDFAALPDNYDEGEAYTRYRRAREETVDDLTKLAPLIRGMLTSSQMRRLPSYVTPYLDTWYLSSVRSGTAGLGLGMLGGSPMGISVGVAGGGGQQIILIQK